MARKAILAVVAATLLLVCPPGQAAWAGASGPLTIVRASVDGNDPPWAVDVFTSVPASGLTGAFEPPPDSVGMRVSLIDYALFRARYLVDFEGALREGIAVEFQRRDRIKRASYAGVYLYCIPAWPLHLLWELPLSGAEKERMLDKEGITIVLPAMESSSVGEIPLSITGDGHLNLTGSAEGWNLADFLEGRGSDYTCLIEATPRLACPNHFRDGRMMPRAKSCCFWIRRAVAGCMRASATGIRGVRVAMAGALRVGHGERRACVCRRDRVSRCTSYQSGRRFLDFGGRIDARGYGRRGNAEQ